MSRILGCCFFLLTCAMPSLAQDFCQWEDTTRYFAKDRIRLALDRNVILEGKWIGVDAQSTKFWVLKSSDRKLFSKGLVTIPRESIQSVAYRGHGNFGKVLGFVAGLALAGAVVFSVPPAAAIPAYVGVIAGGVYSGIKVDQRWHAVRILP